jgi:hypothetical protein
MLKVKPKLAAVWQHPFRLQHRLTGGDKFRGDDDRTEDGTESCIARGWYGSHTTVDVL